MQLHLKNHPTSTAVPNRFIECCIGAPEKYTESYLLGLMYCASGEDIDFQLFCTMLGMSEGEVIGAFEYWQKKGLARILNSNKLCFEFGDFLANRSGDDLYTEREYNQMLQTLFGSRQLSPHEYLKIYDYTDTFGLNKKVVLAMVEYCILLKGRRVSIAYIDKVAQNWAEDENIDTVEKAQAKIASYKTTSSGILRVLKQLGMNSRGPTQDESALFSKWTVDWGFTLDAILTACAHTTSAREPSMKYLDRILERLKNEGHTTSRTISEAAEETESTSKTLKELMHLLGEPSQKPSFEYESLFQKWTDIYGFSSDMLLMAAKLPVNHGKKPFASLDGVLTNWYNNRIATPAAAKKFITEQTSLDKCLTAVFDAAGIARSITDTNRKLYLRWIEEYELSHDAILLAAEISSLSDNPYRYLGTILANWHAAGVKTLADAQRETKKHGSGKTGANNNAAKPAYFERPTENYDHLAIDFFKDEGA